MTKDLDTAFPVQDLHHACLGLTKREWFAGLALQAIIGTTVSQELCETYKILGSPAQVMSALALAYADSLLKELAKEDVKQE